MCGISEGTLRLAGGVPVVHAAFAGRKNAEGIPEKENYGVSQRHPCPILVGLFLSISQAVIDASRVKVARPRRDGCLPSVGRNMTTTILLVFKQLPQQPCRRLKAPRRHSVFAQWGLWVTFPLCATGSLGPLSLLRAVQWTGSLTTSGGRPGRVFGLVDRDHVMFFACRPPFPSDGLPLDPQSPKGGSQRFRHTKGAHPTASGRLAVAVREQSLLGCQPGCSEGAP